MSKVLLVLVLALGGCAAEAELATSFKPGSAVTGMLSIGESTGECNMIAKLQIFYDDTPDATMRTFIETFIIMQAIESDSDLEKYIDDCNTLISRYDEIFKIMEDKENS